MFTIALNYRLHLACSGQGNAVGRVRLSDRFRSDLNQQTVISCARVGRDLGLKVEVIGQGQGHRSTKNTRAAWHGRGQRQRVRVCACQCGR